MTKVNNFVQQGASVYNVCDVTIVESHTAKAICSLLNRGLAISGRSLPKIKRITPRGKAYGRMMELGFKAK